MLKPFCANKISGYRAELMGVATIFILVVHSYDNGVVMPNFVRTICAIGSLGVDIFLLVSGFGLWHSLNKMSNNEKKYWGGVPRWYLIRYRRILVPYIIIRFPVELLTVLNGENIVLAFLDFSTLNFWLNHRGPWYVAMLIPLYAIAPIHYRITEKMEKPIYFNISITTVAINF